jgi:hypothetical protein
MIDEYDFYEEAEDYEEYTPDHYFEEAQEEIKGLYEENRESVFYLRQLQVKLEKKYFHWVTNNALLGLIKIGYLKDYRIEREKGTSTRYFIHHSNRYAVRAIRRIEEVINEYSQDNITRGCGYRAEDLFCKALSLHGFQPVGEKIKEYNGKRWTKTGHDLDFIFVKDRVEYGCEIKNTLGYIDKEELDIKIEMCAYFNVVPLFIMRYAPKSYNHLIYTNGGFALIFETQIYELGQVELVNKIKEIIGLPVICTKGIPDGIIDRFSNWHNKIVAKRK